MLGKRGFLFVVLIERILDSFNALQYYVAMLFIHVLTFKVLKIHNFFFQNTDLIFKHRLWKRQRICNIARQLL